MKRLLLVAALACAVVARPAMAQGGFVLGGGGQVGVIGDTETGRSRFDLALHLRAGWAFSRTLAVMGEVTHHGLTDESPAISDITPGGQVNRTPRIFGVTSVLLGAEIGDPQKLYVRPAVGIAQHRFATYLVDTDVQFAEVSKEWGPALSLAVGRQVNVVPGFPLAFEGVAALTHGEDSSGSRWSAGVQIAREIRF